MSKILPLGAINKKTREYVYPKVANKKDKYVCPDCNKDLILCKGKKRIPHFRHKVDSVNPCHHYSNPSESQIHKDAKILLKNLLERKIPISFIRECCSCKIVEEFEEIPEMTESSTIRMEYGFQYNDRQQIADVAYLDNDKIFTLFEICHTHKTRSEKRPEPWFEIDAEKLIRLANDDSLTSLQIPCIRCEKCDECIEMENNKLLNEKKYLLLLITEKLEKSKTYIQQKKWKSLKKLTDIINPIYIKNSNVLTTDNDYHIDITHPITTQKINYHLKRDYIQVDIGFNKYTDNKLLVNSIRDWLREYSEKLEDVKKWGVNHKYLKGLLFILSSSLNEIDYDTKKQNNIDSECDFILWLNSFDNKLPNLTDGCLWFEWKIDNVISWLKSDGNFKRCIKCKCVYSYSKDVLVCKNKYCI